jgi:hypothetical protein
MGVEFKKVIPRKGVVVRFPRSYSILPESGGNVPWIGPDGRYWRRRVAVGDVEIVSEKSLEDYDPTTNVVDALAKTKKKEEK